MKNQKKSIPQLVHQFAKEWYRDFALPDDSEKSRRRYAPSLENAVHDYMTDAFPKLLDAIMGIKRDWNGVSILESKDGDGLSVAELLRVAALKQLKKQGAQLLGTVPLKLNKRELASLRASYRKTLVAHLDESLCELAKARAETIAEYELDKLMNADEWVAIIEHRVANTRKKKVVDA